jgi:hypothetical protein
MAVSVKGTLVTAVVMVKKLLLAVPVPGEGNSGVGCSDGGETNIDISVSEGNAGDGCGGGGETNIDGCASDVTSGDGCSCFARYIKFEDR